MDGIALWAPPMLADLLAARFPVLRPLPNGEALWSLPPTTPLLLAGAGLCPPGWLLFPSLYHPRRPLALLEFQCAPLSAWIAWDIGLTGVLDFTLSPTAWLEALHRLAQGQPAWIPPILDRVQAFEAAFGRALRQLSPRDWRRWRDLAAGLPLKALARRWGLSPAGVSAYRRRLALRLGARSPEEVVALGFALGIWEGRPGAPRPAPPLLAWGRLRPPPRAPGC